MPPKTETIHKDKLGKLLKVGDCVAYPSTNRLDIGTIKKLNPKMVNVWRVGATPNFGWYRGSNKYPNDLVLLDGPEVTIYLLKKSG
jgi:hypothetical protein